MVLDMPKKKVHWSYLGQKVSQNIEELPSGHVAIDIFEFPKTGWKSPHATPSPALGGEVDPFIRTESF